MVILADKETTRIVGIIAMVLPIALGIVKLIWQLTEDRRNRKRRERSERRALREAGDFDYEAYRKRGKKYLLYAAGLFVLGLICTSVIHPILGLLFGFAIMIFFVLGVINFIKGRKQS